MSRRHKTEKMGRIFCRWLVQTLKGETQALSLAFTFNRKSLHTMCLFSLSAVEKSLGGKPVMLGLVKHLHTKGYVSEGEKNKKSSFP